MLREAVYHRPKNNWSYAYDRRTVHIRIRTKRGDVDRVQLLHGDKYDWHVKGHNTSEMKIFAQDALFDYWLGEASPPFRRLKYGFLLYGGGERLWLNEQGFQEKEPHPHYHFEYPFLNAADVFEPPAWVKDAVFYQIFPERFANGDASNDPDGVQPWGGKPEANNFFGGDLQGVIDHLDHLERLGVNAIYLNPVFQAATNHKYDTEDYLKVDAHFGTNGKLKELVDKCHARGIRVLLDAVFNHSGRTFAPFEDVLEKGAGSAFADWFHVRDFPLEVRGDGIPTYDAFAYEPHMPKLNTENAGVQEYLLQAARYWIEEIGVDGWRLDVANEVDHRFWRRFRDVVKAAKPDAYILGEIWHDSQPWLGGDQFDAVMNYPLTAAILDYAVRGTRDGRQFADLTGHLLAAYPQQATEAAFNLLGSHDTPRLLTMSKGDKRRVRLASVIQFTMAGAPCIYYGDEFGMEGGPDPGCRGCMVWDQQNQDTELFAFFAGLVRLRKAHRALRDGSFRVVSAKADSAVFAYEREADGERFVMVLNAGKRSRSVSVAIEAGGAAQVVFGNGEASRRGAKLRVSLPPLGCAVVRVD